MTTVCQSRRIVIEAMDTASMRQLLNNTFGDEELTTFCYDNFRPVYDKFGTGMSKGRKIQELLDYCVRFELSDQLLSLVEAYRRQIQAAAQTGSGPPATTVSPPPSSPAKPGWVPFKLQLDRLAGRLFAVRALETPMGEPRAEGQLPYDAANLVAILKLLEIGEYDPSRYKPAQTEILKSLDLLQQDRLVSDLLPRLGQGLFQALFASDIGDAFKVAFSQARRNRDTVALQLRFDQDSVDLARYPWELLHDGQRHLLSAGAVELTRYISYPEATTSLAVSPPWRLLYIDARPSDLVSLPDQDEQRTVWRALQTLSHGGGLQLDRLESPTYEALLDQIDGADYHILHFDGHGLFAKCCAECRQLSYPHLTTCPVCEASLAHVPAMGYLAFEDADGRADYVGTEALENLVYGSSLRLVVVSACQSSVVRGETLFGGLGPGLIRAGVPAVVAMQFSLPVEAVVSFAKGFYSALAQDETISRAVARGRRRLFRDKTWYMPTLYLRSTDDEGRLFAA